jgi:APA family basic amino acid/polyamine antiporter
MATEHSPELTRAIGLRHATAMVIGTIIGASIFVQPSLITGQVQSIGAIFLVWLVAGVLTLFGALVCAELASMFPKSGGVYVFLNESYSPAIGFLWGWAMFWTMHSGIIAAVAVVFARYVAYFTSLNEIGTKAVAVGAIVVLSAVNYRGVRPGSIVQASFTWGKVLAIMAMIAIGFVFGSRASASSFSSDGAAFALAPREFALALVAGLFAFGGWHMVTYNAGETIEPRRTIPRALLIGVAAVTVCYIALNAVYLYVLPLETLASSRRVAADAADSLFESGGGATISALVIFSTFGALSGIVLAGPRVYYAMAGDGLVFRWLGRVHARYRTPHRAIVLQAVWASLLVGTGTYRALFTRVIYTEWIFFGLMALGLMRLRRRRGVHRRYSSWGYPWVPALFVLSAFAIVVNQIVADPRESLIGLSLVLIGLPVYYGWIARQQNRRRP